MHAGRGQKVMPFELGRFPSDVRQRWEDPIIRGCSEKRRPIEKPAQIGQLNGDALEPDSPKLLATDSISPSGRLAGFQASLPAGSHTGGTSHFAAGSCLIFRVKARVRRRHGNQLDAKWQLIR